MRLLQSSCAWMRRRPLLSVVLACAVGLLAWLGASWGAAYALTRRPRAPFAEPPPAVAWGELQAVRLDTRDGEQLGAWFSAGPASGPAVVLLHGHGESRGKTLPMVQFFTAEQCSVLAVSLRAHGDSTGTFNDFGYSARHDVVAAVEYLEQRRPGRPIVVVGRSMGAAAAVYAAGPLGTRVHGYILEAAYADLTTAVRHRTENRLPFPLSRLAYAGLTITGPLVLPELQRMAPVDYIGAIPESIPLVLLAGGQDRSARPEEAEALFEQVKGHARLTWFRNAAHQSLYDHDPALYRTAVIDLLQTCSR